MNTWLLAGWTMVHFLWIGALVAAAGAVMRLACRRASPGVRYGVSLVTLLAVAALPLGIAARLAASTWGSFSETADVASRRDSAHVGESLRDSQTAEGSARVIELKGAEETGNLAPTNEQTTALRSVATGDRAQLVPSLRGRGSDAPLARLVELLPYLWLVGAPLTFLLLAAGLVGSGRLRRAGRAIVDGPAAEACARLRAGLRISRRVALAVVDGLAQPVLVGIVRPTILLPAAALSGWTVEELEMVLLHELAHVKRWDNLVNLVQRIIESLLFFHPSVWLASRQVRHDREECCDAIVIRHTARPEVYASLLVSVAAGLRSEPGRPRPRLWGKTKLAASSTLAGHPLAGRVRRILKLEDEPMWVSRRMLGMLVVFALLASLWVYRAAFAVPAPVRADIAEPQATAVDEDFAAIEVADLESVRASVKRDLQRNLLKLKKLMIAKGQAQFMEVEYPKLKADIQLYQSQLIQIDRDIADIEVMKQIAIMSAQSASALETAVATEMNKDPTISMYKEQMFMLSQQIEQLKASVRKENSQLRRLEGQYAQTEQTMQQYRAKAAAEARKRLAKVPNENLRAAMIEYEVRLKYLTAKKKELTAALRAAEDRIEKMSRVDPEIAALQIEIESQEKLIALLDERIAQRTSGAWGAAGNATEGEIEDRVGGPETTELQLQSAGVGGGQDVLELRINANGSVLLDGVAVTIDQLRERLVDRARGVRRVRLSADASLAYEVVIAWMDALRAAGVHEVSVEAGTPLGRIADSVAARERVAESTTEDRAYPADAALIACAKILAATPELLFSWKQNGDSLAIKAPSRVLEALMFCHRAVTQGGNVIEGITADEFARLFAAGRDNPTVSVVYSFAAFDKTAGYANATKDVLDGFVHDPYGPNLPISMRDLSDGECEVTMPRAAHAWLRLITAPESPLIETLTAAKSAADDGAVGETTSSTGVSIKMTQGPRVRGSAVIASFSVHIAADAGELEWERWVAYLPALLKSELVLSAAFSKVEDSYERLQTIAKNGSQVAWLRKLIKVSVYGEAKLIELVMPADEDGANVALMTAVIEELKRRLQEEASAPATTAQATATQLSVYRLRPGDALLVRAIGVMPESPVDGEFLIEEEGTLALGPGYGRVEVAGRTVREAEAAVLKRLREALKDVVRASPRVQVSLASKAPRPEESGIGPAVENLSPAVAMDGNPSPSPSPPGRGIEEPTFLFDDKTFDEWREQWRMELKVEKRMEAVEAMAAFARAGYGREAAEALFDVAGEYDFSRIDESAEGRLKTRVLKVLTTQASRIEPKVWLPALMERLAADNAKWRMLTEWLLDDNHLQQREIDAETRALLIEMARDERYGPNAIVLLALLGPKSAADPQVDELVRAAFTSEDKENALSLLLRRPFQDIDRHPEQMELFFDADDSVRRRARFILSRMQSKYQGNEKELSVIMVTLLKVLDDSKRAADHVNAIRALAAMGEYLASVPNSPGTRSVVDRLTTVVEEGDEGLLLPVYVALRRIEPDRVKGIADSLSPERRRQWAQAIKGAWRAEDEQLLEPQPEGQNGRGRPGDGGGFF